MSTIKRINGKTGISFQITVTQGRDINGRQVRHYRTWKPEGRMRPADAAGCGAGGGGF